MMGTPYGWSSSDVASTPQKPCFRNASISSPFSARLLRVPASSACGVNLSSLMVSSLQVYMRVKGFSAILVVYVFGLAFCHPGKAQTLDSLSAIKPGSAVRAFVATRRIEGQWVAVKDTVVLLRNEGM